MHQPVLELLARQRPSCAVSANHDVSKGRSLGGAEECRTGATKTKKYFLLIQLDGSSRRPIVVGDRCAFTPTKFAVLVPTAGSNGRWAFGVTRNGRSRTGAGLLFRPPAPPTVVGAAFRSRLLRVEEVNALSEVRGRPPHLLE